MVVNGTTWPVLDVAPAQYRLRLLNGSNSRFINLSMFEVVKDKATKKKSKKKDNSKYGLEHPFYQIGGDQGFLPQVVQIQTGMSAVLPGNGAPGVPVMLPDPMQALLMAPAERADVIVDFSGLPDGTIIRILNTAPDAPFGGFPDDAADPDTTGQVMQFVVKTPVTAAASDTASTPVLSLVLPVEDPLEGTSSVTRPLSLNEEESMQICVTVDPTGAVTTEAQFPPHTANIAALCAALKAVPQAPKAALLGTVAIDPLQNGDLVGVPMMWKDPITEVPVLGATETWEFYNFTVDGHPIHMHLVGYEIIDRQLFDPISPTLALIGAPIPPLANELGRKDTVLAYPGEVTRVKATFDLPGLYVWHCHIVEHEDNEMMRPFYVNDPDADGYVDGSVPIGFPRP
ncbi:MAG: multicopper oxidase domain-containing protein, partial [Planctomycetales bacterium]